MIFDANSSILVLFCRRPSLGVGKQRIAAELGEQRALELSELLLSAALEDAAGWPDQIVIAPASEADAVWAAQLIPDARVIPQPEGDLGTRIQTVDQTIREQGGEIVLFIGSDAPVLDPGTLITALAQLEHSDTVLAPARDGGVTLMGARTAWPELTELAWETSELASSLSAACNAAGQSIALLPESYDIDTRADLPVALADLEHDPRPTRQALCQWIRAAVPSEDRLSVVIPVLNDLHALKILLDRLQAQAGINEIVVADGGAEAECRQLCLLRDVHYICTQPGRGQQLIAGATRASGNILWFLHADNIPHETAADAIRRHVDSGYSGGYFRFRFIGPQRWYKTLLEQAINLRTRFGIPYGDQGLFMRREAYTQAGGYTPTPLFEEVKLIKNLRRQGRFKSVPQYIGVSPRRWEREGWLRRSLHNRLLACGYMLGIRPEKLARSYRSIEDTKDGQQHT